MKKHMKRYLLISVMALSIALGAAAQGSKTDYPAMVELDKVSSVWFNSANAAGMTVDPLIRYNDLSFGYSLGRGDFRTQPEGNTNIFGIQTSGATNLGRGQVWGSFSYQNHSAKETRFNTMTLNLEDDLPFIVSDANVSPWKKQRYDLAVKASTPLLGNLIALGVSASYFTESGAKQVDPRCTDYEYGVVVEPSLAFHFHGHTIGLSGIYRNGKVREVPVNSNSQQDQVAYILRGLGNYTDAVVGSLSGIGTFYYNRNLYGASLQYGFGNRRIKVLAEGGYSLQFVDAFQTPTKPQRMGSTKQEKVHGQVQFIVDGDRTFHKVTAEGTIRITEGVEFLQELDKEWETIASYVRSDFYYDQLAIGYNFFRKNDVGYSWTAGLRGIVDYRNDAYLLPESSQLIHNATGEIFGGKNFQAGTVSILLTLRGAYRKNISSSYEYGGAEPQSVIITDFYQKDFAYNSADYFQGGARLNVAFPLRGRLAMFIQADGNYTKPIDLQGHRLNTTFTVGFTF